MYTIIVFSIIISYTSILCSDIVACSIQVDIDLVVDYANNNNVIHFAGTT